MLAKQVFYQLGRASSPKRQARIKYSNSTKYKGILARVANSGAGKNVGQ
jgi:hypothetical protein